MGYSTELFRPFYAYLQNVPLVLVNWKTKAAIQRAFARLPFGNETAYYQLQRWFGNLRKPEPPIDMFRHAAELFGMLETFSRPVANARIVEVGTGHRINMPIAFYLVGAESTVTLDLYPILKPDLVLQAVSDLKNSREELLQLFVPFTDRSQLEARLDRLLHAQTFAELSKTIHLDYRSPCDATRTGIAPGTFDLHFSYTVFEHVPRPELVRILREGSRLIAPDGLLCHHIDLTDHFSHGDTSIPKVNFLRYSDEEWAAIDNPRFGYQNRLREADYRLIYEEAGQNVVGWATKSDAEALALLNNGFPLANQFRKFPAEQLAVRQITALSR